MKRIVWSGVFLSLLVLWFTGCSTPKVDWETRVGSYTHDEAVLELGPPERESKLTDGTVVSEWLVSRLRSPDYYWGAPGWAGGGWWGGWGGWGGYVQSGQTYETYLRLTFAPDGKLRAWKKMTR
jgi:hypothetical protein